MNVRHKRKGSGWRDMMFRNCCIRDDVACSLCGVRIRKMFRKGGVTIGPDGWRCSIVHCCTNLELDHRLPLSEGGNNDLSNLWLLCVTCHKKKTSMERSGRLKKLFAEWREEQAAA